MFFFIVLAPGLISDLRWYGLSTIDPNDCSISMWGTHGCVNIYVYTTCSYIYIHIVYMKIAYLMVMLSSVSCTIGDISNKWLLVFLKQRYHSLTA